MDKITVDLRDQDINNIDEAVELMEKIKQRYPKIDSVIVSRTQQAAIAVSDDELTAVRMKIARISGNPTYKIAYDLYAIKGIEVEVE